MMTEISLNVLDVAQNSIHAQATLVEISVSADFAKDQLTIIIKDNGKGMTKEQVDQVEDPFFTTRTTRKVGLGIPFFKQAALCTGGEFFIQSSPGNGTQVNALFVLSHIDRMPLGDITSTIISLITCNEHIDFIYTYKINDNSFNLDTRQLREILGDISFQTPEVATYIKDYLTENKLELDNGISL